MKPKTIVVEPDGSYYVEPESKIDENLVKKLEETKDEKIELNKKMLFQMLRFIGRSYV